jgi:iron complex transport system substrate-binding protein
MTGAAGIVAFGGGLGLSALSRPPQQVTQTAATTATSVATTAAQPTSIAITDMLGRNITIPTTINRVLTCGPIEMELVYMIAPDKLAGLSFTWNGGSTDPSGLPPLVPDKYTNLPIVGGWFGTQTGNYETFIADKPDIMIDGESGQGDIVGAVNDKQTKFGKIPVVGTSTWVNVTDYAPAIAWIGGLLNVSDSAASLVKYYNDAMNYVNSITSQIPANQKVKVYYAEGNDGFSTDPSGSQHTQLLDFCGATNVAKVTLLPGYGMASTTLEQILLWDPDMILIGRGSQASVYSTILTDSRWAQARAVKNGKVFIRPDNPLSWFDGPPGPSQIVGMYWMVNKLYPTQTAGLDLSGKIKEFYSKFMHYQLTDAQVAKLLAQPTISTTTATTKS